MSAPVLVIDEYNGVPPGAVTQAIPNLVFASIDAPSTTPDLIANVIPPATNSFEKWLKVRVATPAPNTLANVKLVFSVVPPLDSSGAASLSVLYGIGAAYPTFGPTDAASTVAVNPTVNLAYPPYGMPYAPTNPPVVVPIALDNVADATSVFITLQLQASLGAQPGAFTFPADWYRVTYDWT